TSTWTSASIGTNREAPKESSGRTHADSARLSLTREVQDEAQSLLCGSDGDVFPWVLPQRRRNSWKSLAMHCGPLADIIRGVTPGKRARLRWRSCSIALLPKRVTGR